ncbi:MAG: hypothetical protein H8D78_00130 [Chloroflexi bacterium]|nr:hypothetical protein [Chloroflexota bacterium]
MQVTAISDKVIGVINELEPGETLEVKLTRLAEYEIRRRLARHQLTDRVFREKYGMSLEEFEANGMVKKLGYSFEVESDHQDWDLAVDGIKTMQRRLKELRGSQ